VTTADVEMVLAAWVGLTAGFAVLAVRRRATLSGAVRHLDDIIMSFRRWEAVYRARVKKVERSLTEIDYSIVNLENGTRYSADSMRDLRYDLRTRMEQAEAHRELELLVTQGRIPSEHSRSS
jgi:hypothetical protein